MEWYECEWIYGSACGRPQQRRRLLQPWFVRLLLVCHGELGYQRLVSLPQLGQLAEQPVRHQQDIRLLRPLPPELTNGTLITQMVMIKYDFIISDHHLNQRHLRSIALVFYIIVTFVNLTAKF
jgi:hypothetical protein